MGLDQVTITVPIFDGRNHENLTLDSAGFELRRQSLPSLNYYNEQEVITTYYQAVCEFVKEATGAFKVVNARTHNHTLQHGFRTLSSNTHISHCSPSAVVSGSRCMRLTT